MLNPTTITREITRSCRATVARFSLALAMVMFVALGATGTASAQTPPTIDGNLTDMIQFANDLQTLNKGTGIVTTDAANDVVVVDPKVIPCPNIVGGYFQNGFDQTQYVVAQAAGTTDLYLGIRSAGIIGDTDGDGNPDISGAAAGNCNPNDNVIDAPGIGPGDTYQFLFDTACGPNFNPTGTITVSNEGVSGSGIFSGVTGTIAYRGPTGHDLEVKITGLKLPPAFIVKTFVGSNTDGLSEDVGPPTPHQPSPGVDIQKTASPVRVCVGKTTRFTITLTNTGNSDLDNTVVEDDLPPGLTYAGGLSTTCNVGAPQVNGSAINFPAFNLPFGASCTISFDVLAGPECFGTVTNDAHVTASTTGSCVNQPPQIDDAKFDVVCVDNPCVQVTASGPPHACPNAPVTISGNITNCSKNDETVVVTVNGAQAFNALVAAGATVPYQFQGNMGQCTPGGNVPFAVHATATSECGTANADAPTVQVRCDDKPCVSVTCHVDKEAACPGDALHISGNITNCSLDAEQVVVTVGGVQVFNSQVGGGATLPYSYDTTMPACQAGSSVPFPVQATASNTCGPDDVKGCTPTVLCKNPPCVNLTNVKASVTAACPNDPVHVSGTVNNCGPDAADYVVTINGQQVFSGTIPGNGSQPFAGDFNMGACVAGNQVPFAVHATVSNTCGSGIPADASVNVRCKDKPCVTLTGDTNPHAACPGDNVTVSGKAHNCSLDPETIVVTVNGNQVFNNVVQPDADAPYQFQTTMPACTAGANVTYTVVATATGDCPPPDVKTLPLNVLCKQPPCVDLINVAPTVDSTCPNSAFQIKGTVKNCGTDTADYTVSVNGVQVYSGTLSGGATANFTADENAGNCTSGSKLAFTIAAHASNTCGVADKSVDVSVNCVGPSVKVTKTAEASVVDGAIIHYSITVQNNGAAPLENLVITDTMCPYSTYNDNASPNPTAEPAIGGNGLVVWHWAALAPGDSHVFTFQAKASLAQGGASCATTSQVTCTNKVDVVAECAGSGGASKATDHAEAPTTITCPSNNCPRTVGWWAAQCAQKGNGSTKISLAQLTTIAEKVDDISSFFNWSAGTDESNFCRVISPAKPMTLLKQTERQFAGLIANYAIHALGITPSQGGKVELDLNTPINCPGVNAKTVGELIALTDQLLTQLAGANQNDPNVKAQLGAVESCLDAINNGQGIPVAAGCEETGGTGLTSSYEGTEPSVDATSSVQLYRAVPNPFSASTSFSYEVTNADGADVEITVYNVAGRQVRKLVTGLQAAGRHTVTWDGRGDSGEAAMRGVYFVRTMITGQSAPTQRVLFIRDSQ